MNSTKKYMNSNMGPTKFSTKHKIFSSKHNPDACLESVWIELIVIKTEN